MILVFPDRPFPEGSVNHREQRELPERSEGINTTRQTLSQIHQDERRQRCYFDATAGDDHVAEALQDIQY